MALDDTTLVQEIREITGSGPKDVHYYWHAQIRTDAGLMFPLKLLSIDIVRDYTENYSDYIVVEVAFGAGTYAHDILPYKDNLNITLIRDPIGEVSGDADLSKDIENQEFQANLLDVNSAVIEGNSPFIQDKQAGNLIDIVYVKFQLVDKALELIRMESVGGVFRNTATGDILRYLLTTISQNLDVDDEDAILGVDLYKPSNTVANKQLIIPHGTRFTDLPDFVNVKGDGLYSTGMGFYLQHHLWYVYPLYDLTRFDNSPNGLTLINVPKNRFPQIERTFRKTNNQVIALVTGNVKHSDKSDENALNLGNGIRFASAKQVLESFVEIKDNKAMALRVKNVTEMLSHQRENKLNNVQMSGTPVTGSFFIEYSKLAARQGSFLEAVWENSDPGLIYPGMPVKYIYVVEDEPIEVTGIVLKVHHYIHTDKPGFQANRHLTNSSLYLFMDRKINWSGKETDATT